MRKRNTYRYEPGGDLEANFHRLVARLRTVQRCLLVLPGNSKTWSVNLGAAEYAKFHESCRGWALHHGVPYVDGTCWHGYCSTERTGNGSHTVSTPTSRKTWRWLLLASATYAAQGPMMAEIPVSTPPRPYPFVPLETGRTQAPAGQVDALDLAPAPPRPVSVTSPSLLPGCQLRR